MRNMHKKLPVLILALIILLQAFTPAVYAASENEVQSQTAYLCPFDPTSEGAGSNVVNSSSTGRAANKLKPDLNAQGAHSTFKRSPNTGEITNYKTWEPNTKNPSGFDLIKGYDGIGKPHTNSVTKQDLMPHIHDKTVHGGVRVPELWEIPLKR